VDLNGYRLREARRSDWERQADIAEQAFDHNGYVMLVHDRQVDSLDELVNLTGHSEIVLIRLLPLSGG
jgi:hypothetical protein